MGDAYGISAAVGWFRPQILRWYGGRNIDDSFPVGSEDTRLAMLIKRQTLQRLAYQVVRIDVRIVHNTCRERRRSGGDSEQDAISIRREVQIMQMMRQRTHGGDLS